MLLFVPVQSSRRSPVQLVPMLRRTRPDASSTVWAALVVSPTYDVSVRLGIDLWARYGGNLRRSNLLQGVLDRILVYRRIHFGGYSGHRVLITGVSFLVPTWP